MFVLINKKENQELLRLKYQEIGSRQDTFYISYQMKNK